VTSSFTELSRAVRESGLLARTTGFYLTLLAALGLALVAIVAGVVALGSSWWQLALAAALGVVMTQLAFVAHEAAHRQVFTSGPANDRLGRVLANAVVGISYSWWTVKHSRHHANPNKAGADPDIAEGVVSFLPEHAARARGIGGKGELQRTRTGNVRIRAEPARTAQPLAVPIEFVAIVDEGRAEDVPRRG